VAPLEILAGMIPAPPSTHPAHIGSASSATLRRHIVCATDASHGQENHHRRRRAAFRAPAPRGQSGRASPQRILATSPDAALRCGESHADRLRLLWPQPVRSGSLPGAGARVQVRPWRKAQVSSTSSLRQIGLPASWARWWALGELGRPPWPGWSLAEGARALGAWGWRHGTLRGGRSGQADRDELRGPLLAPRDWHAYQRRRHPGLNRTGLAQRYRAIARLILASSF